MAKEVGVNPVAISRVLRQLAAAFAPTFTINAVARAEPVFSFDGTPEERRCAARKTGTAIPRPVHCKARALPAVDAWIRQRN